MSEASDEYIPKDEYVPSAKDAPNGPRNNKDELDEIDARTAEFAEGGLEPLEDDDPFSAKNAPAFMLITLMRIYDAQMAILRQMDEDDAETLANLHANGKLLMSFPYLVPEED